MSVISVSVDMVQAFAAAGESATLEFKKSTAEKDRACRTLCAFANGQGGSVLFGITPAGKVVGQTVTDHTLEELAQEFQGFWNPMIARTFYRRGIIETWGRGTLKIARLMQERGLEPPAVVVRQGAVVITFVLPALVKTPEKTPEKTPQKTPGKTPDAVVDLLRQRPELSFVEVAAILDKPESAIKRAVRKLRESGRLVRIGPDKGGHWQVIK